jgi:hypothetical protein
MLPEQLLANSDALTYFDSVHFLCLTCTSDVLRSRLAGREGGGATARIKVSSRIKVWRDFNRALVEGASEIPTATIVDAGRTTDEVEYDVRDWINTQLHGRGALGTD